LLYLNYDDVDNSTDIRELSKLPPSLKSLIIDKANYVTRPKRTLTLTLYHVHLLS